MLKIFTAYEVEVMRRDAKQRSRTTGVALSKILDHIAQECGYHNWSLLHKNGSIPPDQPQPYLFRRTPQEVAQFMRVIPEPNFREDRRTQAEIARDSVRALDEKFASAANAVDFAIDYVEAILAQPRFSLSSKTVAYWEMRHWLPYGAVQVSGVSHILVNRNYKPQGSTSPAHADYEEFPQLWLQLQHQSWRSFAHPAATQPFLFNDACTPWRNRRNAEEYLRRLKGLREHV